MRRVPGWSGRFFLILGLVAAGCSAPHDAPGGVESRAAAMGLPPEDCSGPAMIVKPHAPGQPPAFGEPFFPSAAGGKLFFRATDRQGLWVSDGTAEGTHLFVRPGAQAPVDVNGRIFFFDQGDLYVSDGTAAGTREVENYNLPGVAVTDRAFSGNGIFYFITIGDRGEALFRSDGTPEGTHLLGSFDAITTSSATLGGATFFLATREGIPGLWRTDGDRVELLLGVTDASSVQFLTRAGNRLYFIASGPAGTTLYSSDGTPGGTGPVKNFGTGFLPDLSNTLRAVNGALFFTLRHASALELWKSDGMAAGTVLVTSIPNPQPDRRENTAREAAVIGNMYLFIVNDEPAGPVPVSMRLWRSDGTAAGTSPLTPEIPGDEGGAPMVAVNGVALFAWREPASAPMSQSHGRELWITDGTVAGTRLLQDLEPGAQGSFLRELTLAGGHVFFVAFTRAEGFTLWALPVACLHAPPPPPPPSASGIHCPSDLTVEATGPEGARVTLPPVSTDDGSPALVDHGPGDAFPLGTTIVTARRANAPAGSCAFQVTVRDTTAPQLYCPPSLSMISLHKGGTPVTYTPVGVRDAVSQPEVQYNLPSGSLFPEGTSEVIATAVDDAGNAASCRFTVTVQPAVTCASAPGVLAGWLIASLLLLVRRRAPVSCRSGGQSLADDP